MPLLVSESKRPEDAQFNQLTQALLPSWPWDEDLEAYGQGSRSSLPHSAIDHSTEKPVQHDQPASPERTLESLKADEEENCDCTDDPIRQRRSNPTELKSLGWLTCPITTSAEDVVLPAISVYSDPEVSEELQMVIHSNGEGTAQTAGCQLRVSLKSQGTGKPSVATWDGIRIKRAGLYVFEVHSVRQPELNLIWDYPITIVANLASQSSIGDAASPEELGGIAKLQMWTT